ncbi:MAG TPA: outer membrane beta-barrel protein [Pyrinomonadaceae bacterium]|nr:outer membrane beta-barrel protein [Pyrinomonadaceae bacterium]
MSKRDLITIAILLLVLCAGNRARAQSSDRRLEVSGGVTTLRLSEPLPRSDKLCFSSVIAQQAYTRNIVGVGGRASYAVTRKIALDGEINYFPAKPTQHFIQSDPRWQGLFGVKAGVRKKRFAIFGKARPGFLHFNTLSHITDVAQVFQQPFGCVFQDISYLDDKQTVLNLDLGGSVEFYLPKRIFIRIDAGDTIIHYPGKTPVEFNQPFTTPNLQVSVGAGIRF